MRKRQSIRDNLPGRREYIVHYIGPRTTQQIQRAPLRLALESNHHVARLTYQFI